MNWFISNAAFAATAVFIIGMLVMIRLLFKRVADLEECSLPAQAETGAENHAALPSLGNPMIDRWYEWSHLKYIRELESIHAQPMPDALNPMPPDTPTLEVVNAARYRNNSNAMQADLDYTKRKMEIGWPPDPSPIDVEQPTS